MSVPFKLFPDRSLSVVPAPASKSYAASTAGAANNGEDQDNALLQIAITRSRRILAGNSGLLLSSKAADRSGDPGVEQSSGDATRFGMVSLLLRSVCVRHSVASGDRSDRS
jgi:hypothetical protein